MLNVLLKNNLITFAVYIIVYMISFFHISYMTAIGIGNEITKGVVSVVFVIIPFILFFCSGKKFLFVTHDTLCNCLSVILLAIILFIVVLISNHTSWYRFTLPFELMVEVITDFLKIPYRTATEKYVYLAITVLPSLSMWLGMMSKKAWCLRNN